MEVAIFFNCLIIMILSIVVIIKEISIDKVSCKTYNKKKHHRRKGGINDYLNNYRLYRFFPYIITVLFAIGLRLCEAILGIK